jgi:hypothetical protein
MKKLIATAAITAWLLGSSTSAWAHKDAYPMSGAEYRHHFDERLVRYHDRFELRMEEHKIPTARREEARKRMGMLDAVIHAAVERAAQDGTVTEQEADQVRDLSKNLREQLYRDLGFERGKGE